MKDFAKLFLTVLLYILLWVGLFFLFFFITAVIVALVYPNSDSMAIPSVLLSFVLSFSLVVYMIKKKKETAGSEPPHIPVSSQHPDTSKTIYCSYCGAQNISSYAYCTGCGKPLAAQPVKNQHKYTFVSVCIVVAVCLFVFIGSISNGDSPSKADSSPKRIATQAAEVTEPPTFTVGDTLALGNILVTLNDVSENSGSQFLTPSEGNVFVTCEFTIENNTSDEIAVSSLMSFECYFDDFSTSLSLSALSAASGNQLDGSVAPGKKIKGIVGYEAPEDWSELEIHFIPSLVSRKEFVFHYTK